VSAFPAAVKAGQQQKPWYGNSVVVLLLLGCAVIVSALAVVYAKYESRTLFVELQKLNRERDAMDVEWGQLQLEQSTWTAHNRIEGTARTRLGMLLPEPDQIVVVRP
jgi:cell division protein FtsL